MAEEEDPFGMGAAPLAEPDGGNMFEAMEQMQPPAPLSDDMGMDMPPPSDMPSESGNMFEDAAPPPAMPMGGMDMGGMGGGLDAGAFSAPIGGEMGPVAKWRIENQEKVDAKKVEADAKVAEKIAEASAALSTFYAELKDKTTKRQAANKEAEKAYVKDRDASMMADSWESVCKLVDLKEKAGQEFDTSRIRSLLIQLKN